MPLGIEESIERAASPIWASPEASAAGARSTFVVVRRVEAQRPVQKPVQLVPQWAQLQVQTIHGVLYCQLFAMSGMFRNQQVAGSSPAGGSTI